MLDALIPAARSFKEAVIDGKLLHVALNEASGAAEKGSKATENLIAKRGRSSYLRERVLGIKDPGAEAIAIIFSSLREHEQLLLQKDSPF